MRRTMNMSNYAKNYVLPTTKMNVEKVIEKLEKARGDFDNLEFKASEVGLKGAQMTVLKELGVVSVIGSEEVWFQIDEDTMKKGKVNVYIYEVDTTELVEKYKNLKREQVERDILYHMNEITRLKDKLANM